jgi:hypothetical protein
MMARSAVPVHRRLDDTRVSSLTQCGGCGAAFEAQAWRALELVERVTPDRVREVLTSWDETIIEVRRCACGRAIARKAYVAATT